MDVERSPVDRRSRGLPVDPEGEGSSTKGPGDDRLREFYIIGGNNNIFGVSPTRGSQTV